MFGEAPPHTHHHLVGTGIADTDTDQNEQVAEYIDHYAYLDFDPLKDNEYALMTEGRGRVALRINFGATDAMRLIPVELMSVSGV
jgi:hypothetical protein